MSLKNSEKFSLKASKDSPLARAPQDKQPGFYSSKITPGKFRLIKPFITFFAVTNQSESQDPAAQD